MKTGYGLLSYLVEKNCFDLEPYYQNVKFFPLNLHEFDYSD